MLPERTDAEITAGIDGTVRRSGHTASDLVTALSDFQQKFDNRQIDALCITLIQAGESGQAVDLLKDMGEQLKDMELTVLQQQKVLWTVVLLLSAGNAGGGTGNHFICLCGIYVPGSGAILKYQ